MKIFNGHCGTIICLDVHERRLVSGARDGMVKGESQGELHRQGQMAAANGLSTWELWGAV